MKTTGGPEGESDGEGEAIDDLLRVRPQQGRAEHHVGLCVPAESNSESARRQSREQSCDGHRESHERILTIEVLTLRNPSLAGTAAAY